MIADTVCRKYEMFRYRCYAMRCHSPARVFDILSCVVARYRPYRDYVSINAVNKGGYLSVELCTSNDQMLACSYDCVVDEVEDRTVDRCITDPLAFAGYVIHDFWTIHIRIESNDGAVDGLDNVLWIVYRGVDGDEMEVEGFITSESIPRMIELVKKRIGLEKLVALSMETTLL